MNFIEALPVAFMIVCFYVAPSAIAWMRGHHQLAAIIATNVLLGWTVLGWIGAFIWSLTAVQKPVVNPD